MDRDHVGSNSSLDSNFWDIYETAKMMFGLWVLANTSIKPLREPLDYDRQTCSFEFPTHGLYSVRCH